MEFQHQHGLVMVVGHQMDWMDHLMGGMGLKMDLSLQLQLKPSILTPEKKSKKGKKSLGRLGFWLWGGGHRTQKGEKVAGGRCRSISMNRVPGQAREQG